MGPLESPFFLWSPTPTPPPTPRPASPPSKRRPPPPPPRAVCSHLSLPASALPLPPPCRPPGALRMAPVRHGTPPGAGLASSGADRSCRSPVGGGWNGRGGHFVGRVEAGGGILPVTVPIWRDVAGEGIAGVPPEMLPPKKRFLRYHPYAAACTIQEMANHVRGHGGGFGGPAALAVEGDVSGCAELLRLRISRPALVLTKRLTPSDRSRDKARLVLPDGLVRKSPLLSMLTAGERRLVFTGENGGLPVPAFDRLGRPYRLVLKRDRTTARTYRLTGQWSLFVSRHAMHDGDAVEVRAFRPPTWQARLDSRGEGGLGMALLLCRPAEPAADNVKAWSYRERGAADGLLLLAGNPRPDGDREATDQSAIDGHWTCVNYDLRGRAR